MLVGRQGDVGHTLNKNMKNRKSKIKSRIARSLQINHPRIDIHGIHYTSDVRFPLSDAAMDILKKHLTCKNNERTRTK